MRHPEKLTPKSKTHTVSQIDTRNYTVTSGSTGNEYSVTILDNGASCSCDWAKYRPSENQGRCGCSHVLSVMAYQQAQADRKVSKVSTSWTAARKNHRKVLDIGDGLLLSTRKA